MDRTSRRGLLGVIGTGAIAGCLGGATESIGAGSIDDDGPDDDSADADRDGSGEDVDEPGESDDAAPAEGGDGPPTRSEPRYVPWDLDDLFNEQLDGGPGVDGIPSIDEPVFADADDEEIDLHDDHPVFGVAFDGDARAYPQEILVWHEIVNDTIAGESVAVTYCPLTGTAQGFYRRETTLGVSGMLVNSNLIMWARATDSRWPQVLATAMYGEHEGESLREFQVIWTSWERWRSVHPDTKVLTENTGFQRRYGDDPYGSYADGSRSGYYAEDVDTMFPPLETIDAVPPKRVVVGTRTTDGALAFEKEPLLEARLKEGSIDDTSYLAVADHALATAYVYEGATAADVDPIDDENAYRVDGETYAPGELPFDRRIAFDAMHFAWYGFYPDTEYVA